MFLNMASYRFVDLSNLQPLRQSLFEAGERFKLRGTILIAPEGFNAFICSEESQFRDFSNWLNSVPELAGLDWKQSLSKEPVFKRWKVKIKAEIITFKQQGIRPAQGRATSVSPATLKKWLDQGHDDEGQEVLLLDTRNDFEVALGSFEGAIDPNIKKFSDLSGWIDQLGESLKPKRIVSFCTGGIRCEKSALHMQALGYEKVSQLEGGILRYFEEVGGAHWKGSLFVFDERVGLAADLTASSHERDESGGVRAKPE